MNARDAALALALPCLALAGSAGTADGAAGAADSAAAAGDAVATYAQHCASCHGAQRYGGYAPPLIPATLVRQSNEELERAILEGRPNTQMAPFGAVLAPEAARSLVELMRSPTGPVEWGLADIRASREEHEADGPSIPIGIRRENLTLVVERGSGSVAVLDGDTLVELDRFEVGRIHGGPKFDADFRTVFASTRDGTVVEYDLTRGGVRSRAKVAVNTRNIAISPQADFVAVANQLPTNLVLLNGDLEPLRVFSLPGKPSGVYQEPGRDRFILTLRDAPLLYILDYPGLELRSVDLPEPFEDFVFVPGTTRLLASSRGGRQLLLYDYESNRVLGSIATEGMPHLFSATFFTRDGALWAAVNHIGVPRLSIIRMDDFQVEREIPLAGSGYFVRTHPGSPYLWADTNTDRIQLIDKQSFALIEDAIIPEPGKTAMHVEFTADGARAFVSVWHDEGAVVVYDSTTLEEVARLGYAMPIGKYNAFNKTHLMR